MKVGGAALLLFNEGRAEQSKPRALSFDCLLSRCTWAKHANAKTSAHFQCDHFAQTGIEGLADRACEATDLHGASNVRQYFLLDPQWWRGACGLQSIGGVSATGAI